MQASSTHLSLNRCLVFTIHCLGLIFLTAVSLYLDHSFRPEADLHSLVREEKYAARISMEWLSEWFELVGTAVCNLHD
jgi:hypothetical protein